MWLWVYHLEFINNSLWKISSSIKNLLTLSTHVSLGKIIYIQSENHRRVGHNLNSSGLVSLKFQSIWVVYVKIYTLQVYLVKVAFTPWINCPYLSFMHQSNTYTWRDMYLTHLIHSRTVFFSSQGNSLTVPTSYCQKGGPNFNSPHLNRPKRSILAPMFVDYMSLKDQSLVDIIKNSLCQIKVETWHDQLWVYIIHISQFCIKLVC